VLAQEAAPAAEEEALLEEVVVVGSRRDARSAADTVAPVDVISGSDVTDQATSDISDLLRVIVPSYNVNTQPISDAATIVRPANLRGLSPDNTLVLLNGKRRHRASVISFLGGGIADGAHGPDIGVFPAIGLKQVEVLRDGASSQYGSDAIAGVINFVLKDDNEGGSLEAKYGSTYEGDGTNVRLAGNIGLPLGSNGFVNVSAEYIEADDTIRSVQRTDAAALIAAGNSDVASLGVNTITTDVAQIWGQPNVNDDFKIFINTGYRFNESVEFYAFGNYAERQVEGGFFFRNPTNRGGVYAGPTVDPVTGAADPNGVASVLVGDLSVDSAGDCPAGIPLTGNNGLIPDPTVLAQVTADANCFSFVELAPGGFVPRFGGDTEDSSIVAGFRGEINVGSGLGYDISYTRGENKTSFFINNTVNASLGPNTPRDFFPGAYEQEDENFNLDLTYSIPVSAFASDLYISGGFEHRSETFTITQGELASRQLGPLSAPSSAFPLGQGFASSSNGFGGFTIATSQEEKNSAVYLEFEADVTDQLTLQAAGRHEDYDSFGTTFDWKIGGLYKVNENLRFRGTYSTGFHAPTAGQANVVNVTTQFVGGVLTDVGTLPLSSGAGQFVNQRRTAAGLQPFELGPEEAKNLSLGVAFNIDDIEVTIDFFNIELEGRIATTDDIDFIGTLSQFAGENGVATFSDANGNGVQDSGEANFVTSQLINALNGIGGFNSGDFVGSEDLSSFRVFANNFDTETRGVDIVASMPVSLGFGGESTVALAMNYTDTEVTNRGVFSPIGDTRLRQLEENIPKWKGNISFVHTQDIWRVLARVNFHGDYFEAHLDDIPVDVGGEATLDVEVTAEFIEGLELTLGAANIFDSFPDELASDVAGVAGSRYPATAPFGFNGGQYYVRARYHF
ncbi:MAG: TonB-dependent receptor, partial [Pseudomonadota bacterium]